MKKTILTIIGLAMASPAWTAQTAVTQISGTQASVGALKTQVNAKLGTVELNRQDHETRVAAMEAGKETKAVVQASAPADTTVDWYDTDQESGVLILKRHNGTTWLRASSHGVQYLSNCLGISAGFCVDTDDGKLYYHNNTSVVEVGSGGAVDLSAYLSKTNTTAFTPTADYHPATMKFVLDSITAGGGYTDEQAQDAVGGMFSGNTETGITVTYDDVTGKINFVSPTTSASFTDDSTHRLVTDTEKTTWNAKQNALVAGTDYLTPNGSAANLTSFPTLNQNTTGSAATLTTARTIGGVSFNGSANINLPGVNTSGTQNTTGNASTATALAANGANCSAGQAALGVNASGAAEGCWTPSTGSMTYPSANNFGWTANGTSWTAMGLDTDISSVSTSDDTVPSAKATKAALDLKANASSIAFEAATWADLKILDTTHTTAGTGIAIVQDAMAYGHADDAYHLWSIDKVGSELALKLPVASPTSTGKFTTTASATGGAGFNLPHGTAPTSPVNGDFWTTTLGVYARINGSTVGPFGSSAGITTADIDTSAELRAILGDEVGTGAAYFIGGALGTPASATLTNATGLPLSGVLDSTTEPLGAGTIELGAASDTTLARSAAGIVTVEAVPLTRTIANGAYTVDTASIPANTCATAVAVTATNTATTDTIVANSNATLSSIAGFGVTSAGAVRVDIYPTANNVNFQFCNPTGAAIDPGSVTFNWKVLR